MGTSKPHHPTVLQRFLRRPSTRIGSALLIVTMVPAVVIPIFVHTSPTAITFSVLAPPSWSHLFGTDDLGRDVFVRVLYGARVSMLIAISTSALATVIGAILGLIAGYFSNLDYLIMRLVDTLMAFPSLLLALGIMAALGAGPGNVVLALTVVYTMRTVRIARSAVLSAKEELYVESAAALGGSTERILLRHILPNTLAPLIVQASFVFGYAILAEAGLSFIGVGIQPPVPSLGNILEGARDALAVAPWESFFPGAWIVFMVMGINLLGDGLREIVDPRMRM